MILTMKKEMILTVSNVVKCLNLTRLLSDSTQGMRGEDEVQGIVAGKKAIKKLISIAREGNIPIPEDIVPVGSSTLSMYLSTALKDDGVLLITDKGPLDFVFCQPVNLTA